ncbi:hypothetical protein [Halalkalicoccus sp. NIPERK01]|uniref:hypothetical protein n=1 Tax=Halalkalicoccus sp. NIPERK01 TaxID=3053469 RepID=UPI00256EFB05|nr:hypothetical protein [Halalkalicoccus sp. NIPERK01]MDL5362727.1 hypothetical protein [Halalkalicoccus sp. NIPERK01]
MSASDRTFDDAIAEAKALLEGHADAEYEALPPSAKANYQEALEFLLRLESSLDSERDGADDSRSPSDRGLDGSDEGGDAGFDLDCDLESTMGDDGTVVGPFGGHDVVVYDPAGGEGQWISMDYDATVSIERMR